MLASSPSAPFLSADSTFLLTPSAVQQPNQSGPIHQNTTVLMAQIDSDVLGDIGSAFQNFIDSGQVWALLIGIVLGYVVRGITTYK